MAPLGLLYVMLNKPRKVISTTRDPEQRRSVTDMVSIEGMQGPARLFPVGRLDADSTGLILLTNDGELANRLTHARYGVTKEYLVSVKGRLEDADVARFQAELNPRRQKSGGVAEKAADHARGGGEERVRGLGFGVQGSADSPIHRSTDQPINRIPEQVHIISRQRDVSRGDRTQLKVVLREGQHRGVRRLMAWLGFKVRRIQRVAIGPLQLKGLTPGRWRMLEPGELRALKQAVGM
jgi:23S rRNA pseudouridine2605 synthase